MYSEIINLSESPDKRLSVLISSEMCCGSPNPPHKSKMGSNKQSELRRNSRKNIPKKAWHHCCPQAFQKDGSRSNPGSHAAQTNGSSDLATPGTSSVPRAYTTLVAHYLRFPAISFPQYHSQQHVNQMSFAVLQQLLSSCSSVFTATTKCQNIERWL